MNLAAPRFLLAAFSVALLSACMQTAGGPAGRGPGALPLAPRAAAVTAAAVPEGAGHSAAG